ncbi:CHAP domain-containing protein [Kitasatospora sp. NPDC088134]|uniref:CHAP domain-containing protein n=1 Tax=Kitasatospora sp. NPDC088134 TaxID=3364071 RepID=UPI0038092FF7
MPSARRSKLARIGLAAATAALPLSLAFGATPASASVGTTVIGIAAANLGNTGSGQNSAGGYGYYNSANENWCADFAKWVWAQDGVDVSGLDARAASFAEYRGGLSSTPHVGDAVVFEYNGAGWAQHVALVASVNSDGTIGTIGGNQSGVVSRGVISASGYYGSQHVSGYASPKGGRDDTPPSGSVVQAGQVTSVMVNGVGHVFQVTSSGGIRINDGHYPSSGWTGWQSLDGSQVSSLASAAEGSRVHLFAVMQDGTLREAIGDYSTGTWGGWHVVEGSQVASLEAVTVAGRIRLYAVLQNGAPRSADLDPATDTFSTGWYDLTGGNVKQLAAAAVGSTVRLFAVTNDGLLHENDGNYAAGGWSGWSNVDGSNVKTLAAAVTGSTVHLYAGTNDGLFHTADGSAPGSWGGWSTQAGSLIDQLDALADGSTVHLYAHTTDGLTHSEDANYTNSTWAGWYNL